MNRSSNSRLTTIWEILKVVDSKITEIRAKKKFLRSERGYKKSATVQQQNKGRCLNTEMFAYLSIRSRISALQYCGALPGALPRTERGKPTKEILVIAGHSNQFRLWAQEFIRDNPSAKANFSVLRLMMPDGTEYRGALSLQGSEGTMAQELIKVGTYQDRFPPEEVRMLEFCVAANRERAEGRAE